ncbi:uncharacterized protein JN550_012932 [Neoarthrinium moseri]|uniref:uncharacterized protein n=1 Tax=Neoarthrinium moseri TaxID=1658444 RepID=UPI001FDE4FE1|nr:uncharacterized protein JN550_012932 [Neoarthrinium moseri]KAI1858039.1 hypothetical protein JN550_012932 [Neoarthrinium moseri]
MAEDSGDTSNEDTSDTPSFIVLGGRSLTSASTPESGIFVPAMSEEMDMDGDLLLQVGTPIGAPDPNYVATAVFRVCSRTLSRASPAWKRMLYGGFKESSGRRESREWKVDLPADDPASLALLLNIMHGRFDKVPLSLSEEELYEVSVLSDKYNLAHFLRPWAPGWAKYAFTALKTQKDGQDADPFESWRVEALLWAAWEMGDDAAFRTAARKLALRASVNDEGELVDGDLQTDGMSPLFESQMEPPSMAEKIKFTRARMLTALKDIYGKFWDGLMADQRGAPICCVSHRDHERALCHSTLLGSMLRSLNSNGLLPFPSAEDFSGNVSALLKTFKNVALLSLPQHRSSCGLASTWQWAIDNAIKDIVVELDDSQVRHLQAQRKKTGL